MWSPFGDRSYAYIISTPEQRLLLTDGEHRRRKQQTLFWNGNITIISVIQFQQKECPSGASGLKAPPSTSKKAQLQNWKWIESNELNLNYNLRTETCLSIHFCKLALSLSGSDFPLFFNLQAVFFIHFKVIWIWTHSCFSSFFVFALVCFSQHCPQVSSCGNCCVFF